MISDLLISPLLLVGLVWLCLMLYWAWPSDCVIAHPTPPRRKRSRASKPFAGLTHKPRCDACEHTTDSCPHAPSAPPSRIVSTRGRRRQVDTATYFCPNPDCRYRGWAGWGNIRANGHPNGGSCTSSLRIIQMPENQVASLCFTDLGGGTRDGARPGVPHTLAAWNPRALCEPDLGLATAPRGDQPCHHAGYEAFTRE
jgi:hypothetical protein